MTPKRPHGITARDDVLDGFNETGPTRGQYRGFFATLILASLWAWELAFEYGTHHVIFYRAKTQFFAISTALLLGALILRRRIRVHTWMLVVLAIPILIVVLRLAVPVQPENSAFPDQATQAGPVVRVIEWILLAAMILVSPAALWAILRLVAPEYFTLPERRLKVALVAVLTVVAAAGLLVGRYNDHFFTCNDFVVAGDDPPSNCAQGQ